MTAERRGPSNVGRKPKPGGVPDTTQTKLARDVHRKAKIVATHKGVELYEYLDAILRPVVDRDFLRMIRDEAREGGQK